MEDVMCCAAVNFAQYDFSGLTLNRSPLIRAAIPEQGTPAYEVCWDPTRPC